MAIPSQQINWSVEAKLLWQILKQLEYISRQLGSITVTVTTTHP